MLEHDQIVAQASKLHIGMSSDLYWLGTVRLLGVFSPNATREALAIAAGAFSGQTFTNLATEWTPPQRHLCARIAGLRIAYKGAVVQGGRARSVMKYLGARQVKGPRRVLLHVRGVATMRAHGLFEEETAVERAAWRLSDRVNETT